MENIRQMIKLLNDNYNLEGEKFNFSYLINNLNNKPINNETMERAIKSKATIDDIRKLNKLELEIEELKEELKKNNNNYIEENLEKKENELKELINVNENNIVELNELINKTDKLGFYIPNKEEYKNKLIFDGKNVILQDSNNNEIERISYTKFGKEMFFDILEDIYINGEKSIFFIKNYNNLSIVDIIVKHCRIDKIITLNEIIEYCSKNNIDPTNEKFVSIFCEIGDIETVKYCIKEGAKLNKIKKINELVYNGGNYELIHLLEDIGIESNFDSLLSACANNDLDLINYLLDDNEYDKDNLVELFSVIKDPRIADLILNELSLKGFDINTGGIFSENKTIMKTPLHLAIENNHIETVQYLLNEKLTRQKIDINKRAGRKYYIAEKNFHETETALNYAIENENKEMVELLLKNPDLDVNLKNPLCQAVAMQNKEIIKLLIKYPYVDVNLENNMAFCCAIENNDAEIINLFLEHPNIDLSEEHTNIKEAFIETTLFCLAVKNNNIELAKVLLSRSNINVNAKYTEKIHGGSYEMTPLHFAIDNNNLEMVKLLLSQPNIDVNTKFINYRYGNNNYKNSIESEIPILYYAMRYKPKSYADANLRDYSKTTNPEIVKLLLSHPNIDVNAKYIKYYKNSNKESEKTLLYIATKLPKTKDSEERLKACEIVKLLISCPKLDTNAESVKYDEYGNIKNKKMLFYEAIMVGNIDIANFLLPYNRNIDINKRYRYSPNKYSADENECTLLHLAIKSNISEIVEFLLKNYQNIDVNAEFIKYNNYYEEKGIKKETKKIKETPITMAIYQRNEKMIESLLRNPNLNVNAERIKYHKNGNIEEKETPIHMAIFQDNKELVELLLKNPNLDLDKKYIKYDKEGNIKKEETILYSVARSLWRGKEIFELLVNEKIRHIKEKNDNIEKIKEEILKQKNELNELKKCEELKNTLGEIEKYEEKLNNIENEINF